MPIGESFPDRHDKSNADPGPRCPDPGPVPPVRFARCRGRGPRATCYRLRRKAEKLLEGLARTVEPFRMRQAAYNFLR